MFALNLSDVQRLVNKAIYALTARFRAVGNALFAELPIGAVDDRNLGLALASVLFRWADLDRWRAKAGVLGGLLHSLHQLIILDLEFGVLLLRTL